MNNNGKIVFADQLRVLAFLSVVATHWVGVFWIFPDVISYVIKAPSTGISTYEYINKILLPLPYFDYGNIGVAIFFLISGFVIPFSLRRKSTKGFLIARFVRIYPTYIVSSLLMLAFIFFTSRYYWHLNPEFSFWNVLSNLTLTQSIFNQRSMDAVNWTLSIEVFFYIVIALFRKKVSSGNCTIIFTIAITFGLFVSTVSNLTQIYHFNNLELSIYGLKMAMLYTIYMLIGTLFHYHIEQQISTPKLIAYVLAIFSIMVVVWYNGPFEEQTPKSPLNYSYAILIFSTCYMLRDRFRKNKALSFLSSISYPFYALHSIIGYATLRILFDKGLGVPVSLAITFILIISLSIAVHFTIEKWSIEIGKKAK